MELHKRFWLKTALHLLMPGGYGYFRHLRRYRDPCYEPVSHGHMKQGADEHWADRVSSEGIAYRNYVSYRQYVEHQGRKLDLILKGSGGHSSRTVVSARLRFLRRFAPLPQYLPKTASIVCLGARLGMEVEVLRDLGYRNAYGIDLNPGPDNPFVIKGDFMHMANPSCSVDMIYTNCLDHAFNLDEFFAEHARVIKDDGYAIYDVARNVGPGAFEAVAWRGEEVLIPMMLSHFRKVVRSDCKGGWRWILLQGKK